MGVYKEGYRQYQGDFLSIKTRLFVVFDSEFRNLWRTKMTRRLLFIAAVPLVVIISVLVGKVVVETNVGALPIDLGLLDKLLSIEMAIMALAAAAGGSGMLSEDRRSRALVLYLSRPLTPARYVLGKASALFAWLALGYIVPGLVHILVELLLMNDPDLGQFFYRLFGVLSAGVFHVGVTVMIILTFSSFGARKRYTGLLWLGLYFFSQAISQGIAGNVDASWVKLLSLPDLYRNSLLYLLYQGNENWPSLLVLLGLGLASGAALAARTRTISRTSV